MLTKAGVAVEKVAFRSKLPKQALKLGFARRGLAQARRKRDPAQASLFDHSPGHIWQKRFYDFNVWSEHKRIEKLRYMQRNPV